MIFETSQIVATGLLASIFGFVVAMAIVLFLGAREAEKAIEKEVLEADQHLKDQIAANSRLG